MSISTSSLVIARPILLSLTEAAGDVSKFIVSFFSYLSEENHLSVYDWLSKSSDFEKSVVQFARL